MVFFRLNTDVDDTNERPRVGFLFLFPFRYRVRSQSLVSPRSEASLGVCVEKRQSGSLAIYKRGGTFFLEKKKIPDADHAGRACHGFGLVGAFLVRS